MGRRPSRSDIAACPSWTSRAWVRSRCIPRRAATSSVYNGEVYNFARLADELRPLGHVLRGHSDTEVMLAAIEQWGVEAAAQRFIGIFAFALWDRAERTLHLVRDHVGVKPLYYGWVGGTLVFGSELKALRTRARLRRDDRPRRADAVPPAQLHPGASTRSTAASASSRPAASSRSGRRRDREARAVAFWSAREAVERGASAPLASSDTEAVDRLDALLRDAVQLQMASDVPLGAFLSGGDRLVDGGRAHAGAEHPAGAHVHASASRKHATTRRSHAREVARHLGTDHTELYVTAADAIATSPDAPDASTTSRSPTRRRFPTLLVSRLARRHVTVSLSGDGGDELFGGYNRHVLGERALAALASASPAAVAASGGAGDHVDLARPPGAHDHGEPRDALADAVEQAHRRQPAQARRGARRSRTPTASTRSLVSHWKQPADVVLGAREPATLLTDPRGVGTHADRSPSA